MIIDKDLRKMIESSNLALSTSDKKGNPHCIAVGDVRVVSEIELLIGDNYMKNTIENIKGNHHVCLVVWDKVGMGYRIEGLASYFKDGRWLTQVKEIHRGCPAKGAILVKVTEIERLAG